MVKVKTSEGLVARLLTVGIVRIVPCNKLIDQGLFYKIASVREGSRVRPLAGLGCCACPRSALGQAGLLGRMLATGPFCFLKHFSNLVSKVNL